MAKRISEALDISEPKITKKTTIGTLKEITAKRRRCQLDEMQIRIYQLKEVKKREEKERKKAEREEEKERKKVEQREEQERKKAEREEKKIQKEKEKTTAKYNQWKQNQLLQEEKRNSKMKQLNTLREELHPDILRYYVENPVHKLGAIVLPKDSKRAMQLFTTQQFLHLIQEAIDYFAAAVAKTLLEEEQYRLVVREAAEEVKDPEVKEAAEEVKDDPEVRDEAPYPEVKKAAEVKDDEAEDDETHEARVKERAAERAKERKEFDEIKKLVGTKFVFQDPKSCKKFNETMADMPFLQDFLSHHWFKRADEKRGVVIHTFVWQTTRNAFKTSYCVLSPLGASKFSFEKIYQNLKVQIPKFVYENEMNPDTGALEKVMKQKLFEVYLGSWFIEHNRTRMYSSLSWKPDSKDMILPNLQLNTFNGLMYSQEEINSKIQELQQKDLPHVRLLQFTTNVEKRFIDTKKGYEKEKKDPQGLKYFEFKFTKEDLQETSFYYERTSLTEQQIWKNKQLSFLPPDIIEFRANVYFDEKEFHEHEHEHYDFNRYKEKMGTEGSFENYLRSEEKRTLQSNWDKTFMQDNFSNYYERRHEYLEKIKTVSDPIYLQEHIEWLDEKYQEWWKLSVEYNWGARFVKLDADEKDKETDEKDKEQEEPLEDKEWLNFVPKWQILTNLKWENSEKGGFAYLFRHLSLEDRFYADYVIVKILPFLWHLFHTICGQKTKHFWFLVCLFGWIIQNPGKRAEVLLIIFGNQGIGKTELFRFFKHLFGDYFSKISKKEDLTGQFSSQNILYKLFVLLEETNAGSDTNWASIAKDMITCDFIIKNLKFQCQEPECIWAFFASCTNVRYSQIIECKSRRELCIELDPNVNPTTKFFDRYRAISIHCWAWFFYHIDVSQFQSRNIPMTLYKVDMMLNSLQDFSLMWYKILEQKHTAFFRHNSCLCNPKSPGGCIQPLCKCEVPQCSHPDHLFWQSFEISSEDLFQYYNKIASLQKTKEKSFIQRLYRESKIIFGRANMTLNAHKFNSTTKCFQLNPISLQAMTRCFYKFLLTKQHQTWVTYEEFSKRFWECSE
jgi:hypothetical protein